MSLLRLCYALVLLVCAAPSVLGQTGSGNEPSPASIPRIWPADSVNNPSANGNSRRLINRFQQPVNEANEVGELEFEIIIMPNGTVSHVSVVRTCDCPVMAQRATENLRAMRFNAVAASVGEQRIRVKIQIPQEANTMGIDSVDGAPLTNGNGLMWGEGIGRGRRLINSYQRPVYDVNEEGEMEFELIILPNGTVRDVRIVRSCMCPTMSRRSIDKLKALRFNRVSDNVGEQRIRVKHKFVQEG